MNRPDPVKTPFLFSVGTIFSYTIAREYYRDVHYVWCTSKFFDPSQPLTSNPYLIARQYLWIAKKPDIHTDRVNQQKKGLLAGAKAKFDAGVIDLKTRDMIGQMVNLMKYRDFRPVIYIVNTRSVIDRCVEVPQAHKASKDSEEYIISDLKVGEFEIINFANLLDGVFEWSAEETEKYAES